MGTKSILIAMALFLSLIGFTRPLAPAQTQETMMAQDALDSQLDHHQSPGLLDDPRIIHGDDSSMLTDKQKKSLLQANLAKSKKDAAELADLARDLRKELNQPRLSSLSPDGINRLEKIEKLARKIRDEMKDY